MKTTTLQHKVIELCKSHLSYWISTNDITSPTHLCDIDEDIRNFEIEYNLEENSLNEVGDKLKDLYFSIRNLKLNNNEQEENKS